MHIGLLSWGAIFCLIAGLCILMSKYSNKQKQKWMLCMELFTSLLLASDAFAWTFRGYPGTLGYYMVRISNFLVFALTDIVLLFFICMCAVLSAKVKGMWKIFV